MHLGVRQREISHYTQVPLFISTQGKYHFWLASFWSGEWKGLNIKIKITSSNLFDLNVHHTWASPHSKTFPEGIGSINSTLSRRHQFNKVGDLFWRIRGLKALECVVQIFKLRDDVTVFWPSVDIPHFVPIYEIHGWKKVCH